MIKKNSLLLLLLLSLFSLLVPTMVQARTKTVTSTVREPFTDSQPQESVRFFAVVKARHEALEKSGKYIKKLDIVKTRNLDQVLITALAAGIMKAEIKSQKDYTADGSFGFEVAIGVKFDKKKLKAQVDRLLKDKALLAKHLVIITRESRLLYRISTLKSEYKKLSTTQTDEKDALKQKIQNATRALSAVALYRKAVGLIQEQAQTNTPPQKAIDYLHTAVNLDPEYKDAYLWLGKIFSHKGLYDRAVEYYQKALVIDLKTLGENHPELPLAYNRLGLAFHRNGEYTKALEAYQKAEKIQINTVGESHPDLATTYNNMGESYRENGDLDRAIEYYQKDLEITLKTLGRNHINVATSFNNLGYVWHDKGNDDRAIGYFLEAHEVYSITLGKNHPQTKTIKKTIDVLKSRRQ